MALQPLTPVRSVLPAPAPAHIAARPDLRTYPFKLTPDRQPFVFNLTGNVVYIVTATDDVDIALVDDNYIPARPGRVVYTPADYTSVSIRAAAGVPQDVTGIIVLGHGGFGDFVDPELLNDMAGSLTSAAGLIQQQGVILTDIRTNTGNMAANIGNLNSLVNALQMFLNSRFNATTQHILDAINGLADAIGEVISKITVSGGNTMIPYPTYAALAAAVTAGMQPATLAQVVILTAIPPTLETWQLRARLPDADGGGGAGDITNAANGIITPEDYDERTNARFWYRV